MGNEFTEETQINEIKPIEHSNDEYVKYGIISKKDEEIALEDTFINLEDLTSAKESKNKINFSLFGVFDGHNNDYVAKYLSKNFKEIFEKEAGDINKDNYVTKFEDIFKSMDKNLKDQKNIDIRNEKNEEKIEDKINDKKESQDNNYIKVGVDQKEIDFFKNIIKNTKEIPEELKKVEDSQIKDLLLFRNLFKYNNNYLYNNNDINYIGSSASLVFINNECIITADLGITTSILFNKEGVIVNKRDKNELLKSEHVFSEKKEKKRIKKFNENVDYDNLKLNIYVPASRCFGLFKYKADEILKEENQIISCIPIVNYYERDSVDYILLMTKGMINLLKDNLEQFIQDEIVKNLNEGENINIADLLNKYIEKKIKERKEKEEKEKEESKNKREKSSIYGPKSSAIYVGKEDFGEENEIINELKNNYYKDIMDINKNNCYSCHEHYNITCILMKLSKKKKPIIEQEKKEENIKDKNEDENKDNKKEKIENEKNEIILNPEDEKEEENIDNKQENKEPDKIIEKKDENKEEININKEQDKTEKIEEVNNKDDKKEMEKEKKDDELKNEDKNIDEDNKININIDEENKKKEENKDELNENKTE